MKTILTAFALSAIAAAPFASATAEDAHRLVLTVENIKQDDGTLMIALFKGKEAHASNQAFVGRQVAVEGGNSTIAFDDLPSGDYSIKLFHDVDGDGKMKRGLMGIPSEPWGFSNNAQPRFGPPSWADSRLEISGDLETTIRLR